MQLKKHQSVGLITLLIAGGGWCSTAGAGTIQVCATCSHKTIQSAVNAAVDNDTINIQPRASIPRTSPIAEGRRSRSQWSPAAYKPTAARMVAAAGRGPVFTLGSGVAGDPETKWLFMSGMIISGGNHMGGTGVGGGIQVRAGAYLQISGCTVTRQLRHIRRRYRYQQPGRSGELDPSRLRDLTTTWCARNAQGRLGFGGGVYVTGTARSAYLYNDNDRTSISPGRGGGFTAVPAPALVDAANRREWQPRTVCVFHAPEGPTDGDGGGITPRRGFQHLRQSIHCEQCLVGYQRCRRNEFDCDPHRMGTWMITETTISHNWVARRDRRSSSVAVF